MLDGCHPCLFNDTSHNLDLTYTSHFLLAAKISSIVITMSCQYCAAPDKVYAIIEGCCGECEYLFVIESEILQL